MNWLQASRWLSKLRTIVNERQTQDSQATNQPTIWPQLLILLGPFLCSLPITSHWSLLQWETWQGSSEWLTACQNKNKSEKPCFSSLQHASIATTWAPKQSQQHSPFAAANLWLVRWTHFFLVHVAQLSSARPGQLRNRNKAGHWLLKHPPFAEPIHAILGGWAWLQAPLLEIICSSYPHSG